MKTETRKSPTYSGFHRDQMVDRGYCKCPNSPTRWYPAGPGVPCPPRMIEVHLDSSEPLCFSLCVHPYGKGSELVPVAKFPGVCELFDYIARNFPLERSKPGQRH